MKWYSPTRSTWSLYKIASTTIASCVVEFVWNSTFYSKAFGILFSAACMALQHRYMYWDCRDRVTPSTWYQHCSKETISVTPRSPSIGQNLYDVSFGLARFAWQLTWQRKSQTNTLANPSAPALAMYGRLGWKATSYIASSNFFRCEVISWTQVLLSRFQRRIEQSWPTRIKKYCKFVTIHTAQTIIARCTVKKQANLQKYWILTSCCLHEMPFTNETHDKLHENWR